MLTDVVLILNLHTSKVFFKALWRGVKKIYKTACAAGFYEWQWQKLFSCIIVTQILAKYANVEQLGEERTRNCMKRWAYTISYCILCSQKIKVNKFEKLSALAYLLLACRKPNEK